MTDRPSPETVLHWIDRKLWSANTWLEDHGRHSRKPRPETDIEHREEDIAMFQYMHGCFAKALAQRSASV